MQRFSANLGFLFTDHSLPDAVVKASECGFAAVECHFPYATDPDELRAALKAAELPLLSLNTWPGDRAAGDFGLAAMPDREGEARAEIDRALDYAVAAGAHSVHVMAGRTDGGPEARRAYAASLEHACERAQPYGLTVLIEPINTRDVPGYHLTTVEQAAAVITEIGAPNLRLLFDCYHMQIMGGDLLGRFRDHLRHIGHVQIAGVPGRGVPIPSEIDYAFLLPEMARAGYGGWIGAEYKPAGRTEESLGWMDKF